MLMIGKPLTVEQRLQKAVVRIMDKATALAGVLMVGDRTVSDDVPTARTDGKNEEYGRAFVEKLNDAELRFLILHEVYHKLYKHLTTWTALYELDAKLANMACDYVINIKVVDEFGAVKMDDNSPFVTMPEGGCLDEKFRGMTSKQVFDILRKDQEQQGSGGGGGGDGFDEHDWDGAKEMSSEERKAVEREIDEAIRQGALVAGKLGSGGLREIDELLRSKVNWREALRDFLQTTCQGSDFSTWRRPNRRYWASGIYMPSSVSQKVDELVIAVDTSGSIGTAELAGFLGEVVGVCDQIQPSRVRLLYWDTKVCRGEVYDESSIHGLAQSTKPAGGGGTRVQCVPDHMVEHGIKAQAVVVLTDGYVGSWGTWTCPVLWCIVNNRRATPNVGLCVHIED